MHNPAMHSKNIKKELGSIWVTEKLDWKGLKIKKSIGNRKIIITDEV
jgi:hypothetical protein